MSDPYVDITIHESQHLESVIHELHRSLEKREINPKFLYEGHKQTQRWLAIHKAYSAWNTDPDCARIYGESYQTAGEQINSEQPIAVIGLGCGSGQKEAKLCETLKARSASIHSYIPVDVSPSLVLMARDRMLETFPDGICHPLVFDMARVQDLRIWIDQRVPENTRRIFTYFGMVPNVEPFSMVAFLRHLSKRGGHLLLSANLVPGIDYQAGVKKVLPQYDNLPTREWLMTFLTDLGFEKDDGKLEFLIEPYSSDEPFLRIAAYFTLSRNRAFEVYGREFHFRAGEKIRVFFSYRYTPALLSELLEMCGVSELGRWITRSGEEGVFLLERK